MTKNVCKIGPKVVTFRAVPLCILCTHICRCSSHIYRTIFEMNPNGNKMEKLRWECGNLIENIFVGISKMNKLIVLK